jgi:hypothetical protein
MEYIVTVTGSNVRLHNEPGRWFRRKAPRRFGFATTRIVVALDPEDARRRAIESARAELSGQLANDPADPPCFDVDDADIEPYRPEAHADAPRRGFTFYPER